jgi:DNA-binding response OmpR family regulator
MTTATPATGSGPLRVLVVDDNVDAADSMATLLDMLGHATRVVYTGETVAAEARDFDPDCVLLDIGLPVKDGYAVARELRSEGSRAVLVALTGWGGDGDRRQASEAGFDQHLTKPVEFEALEALLANLRR